MRGVDTCDSWCTAEQTTLRYALVKATSSTLGRRNSCVNWLHGILRNWCGSCQECGSHSECCFLWVAQLRRGKGDSLVRFKGAGNSHTWGGTKMFRFHRSQVKGGSSHHMLARFFGSVVLHVVYLCRECLILDFGHTLGYTVLWA